MLIVRFLCTVLLHIQLEGEIRTALGMIKYFNNHPENFAKGTYAPFYIALMQLLGCIIAELLNIWLVCREDSVKDTLMNYIALGVIAEIDDIYGNSIQNDKLKDLIDCKIEVTNTWSSVTERSYGAWTVRTIYKVLRFFYISVYFYFMPFMSIILS